jgi:hypothetical protein
MSAVFILLLRIFILVLLVVSVQRLVAPSPENAVCGNMFVAGLAARRQFRIGVANRLGQAEGLFH